MDNLVFVTGNVNKIREANLVLGKELTTKNIDLMEVQSLDIEEVAKHKVMEAFKILNKPVIVEDTGLCIDNLNGFPGALIKFYYNKLGLEKMLEISATSKATAKSIIAYYDGINYATFLGEATGHISSTIEYGHFNHAWDPIFIPDGSDFNPCLSYAQMTREYKTSICHRGKAFRKLKEFF
jgi:non-canonical purine NTP pyrophosphatase (RdgB/HAM1 family)